MTDDELSKFIELFDRISKLKVVKCRMAHERVRTDEETGLPLAQTQPQPSYKRIGLCSPEIRAEQLSCGHTMSRYLLQTALSLLHTEGKDTIFFEAEIIDLINNIHLLDHKKGEAEKRRAELIEQKHSEPETDLASDIQTVNTELQNLERRHDEYAGRVSRLRDLIVSEMEAVINRRKDFKEIKFENHENGLWGSR